MSFMTALLDSVRIPSRPVMPSSAAVIVAIACVFSAETIGHMGRRTDLLAWVCLHRRCTDVSSAHPTSGAFTLGILGSYVHTTLCPRPPLPLYPGVPVFIGGIGLLYPKGQVTIIIFMVRPSLAAQSKPVPSSARTTPYSSILVLWWRLRGLILSTDIEYHALER